MPQLKVVSFGFRSRLATADLPEELNKSDRWPRHSNGKAIDGAFDRDCQVSEYLTKETFPSHTARHALGINQTAIGSFEGEGSSPGDLLCVDEQALPRLEPA